MSLPKAPVAGWVIHYAFQWRHEKAQNRGPTKDRPSLIVGSRQFAERILAILCPVTTRPATSVEERDASVEIDETSRRNLGLRDVRQWVRLDQVNIFVWAGYDLRNIPGRKPPTCVYGPLSPRLFEAIRLTLLERQRTGKIVVINRD